MPDRDTSAARPDLAAGAVDNLLDGTRSSSAFRTARYQDSLAMRAETGADLSRVTAFGESGPDPLGEVRSSFESAVVGDQPDTSTWGLLRAIGGAMLTGTSSPIASITDQYQVEKIRELQKAFLDTHHSSLSSLSDNVSKAKRAMRDLAEMVAQSPFDPSRLTDLLRRKRQAGNDTLRDIDERLTMTTDPAERARLQGMRDDLTGWMAERDARTAAEQEQVGDLAGRLQGLESRMMQQRGLLEQAGASEGPRNVTSGGRVVETSHHRPDAPIHVASLQDLLLGAKAGIDQMLRRD